MADCSYVLQCKLAQPARIWLESSSNSQVECWVECWVNCPGQHIASLQNYLFDIKIKANGLSIHRIFYQEKKITFKSTDEFRLSELFHSMNVSTILGPSNLVSFLQQQQESMILKEGISRVIYTLFIAFHSIYHYWWMHLKNYVVSFFWNQHI